MVVDGERLKVLLSRAQREVVLCAPFIKVAVLETLFESIPEDVEVRVYTRWRAAEVAAGVSDLEVFELVNERAGARLFILDALHGKLYTADSECMLGSANLTGPALGWSRKNNIELMVPMAIEAPEVQAFMKRLNEAVPATYTLRKQIEDAAKELVAHPLEEGQAMDEDDVQGRRGQWLPRCAAPEKLYAIFCDENTNAVVKDTLRDGLQDLRDLSLPPGLSAAEFEVEIRNALLSMPSFAQITARIPSRITDGEGRNLVLQCKPHLDGSDAAYLWQIVRGWISVFFASQYEVAAESYVVRLRSSRKSKVDSSE
ncbi:phospholipase D family protein [Candidatus Thiodictyon syntrophicum]|jgi:hypothetical protein|uniref:PLD phosphodiesterase domain-containing protein n=1 Tax=Candidatus Thiodictyon syntrophicum TaxID=1166950 RepID=A0A2K8U2B0_9GAMM|nr:phospholipase D family protein [Candidatus Thiodictyon syntrophicum]AUB79665.1 hypothetical protein THSYN_00945 [Candidatus Thiodictyon syntrophicum]